MKNLKAPARINSIDDIDFLQAIEATRDNVIDFGPVEFIKPVGVVAFLATLDRLTKQLNERHLTFKLPESPSVREYLRLSGVFDVLRGIIPFGSVQPEDVVPRLPLLIAIVPCKYFASEDDIEQLANQMEEDFETVLPGRGSILETCHTAFSEIATNVIYHAESGGGYVLAQQCNYRTGPMVEIAVADCGIGIQASLQKNSKYAHILSDADAIELATKEGTSSLEDRYRGYGLHHVLYDVKRNNNRKMSIRSGHGTITLQGNGNVIKRDNLPNYPGTILNVTIPC